MSNDSKHVDATPDLSFLDDLDNDDKSVDTDQRPSKDGVVDDLSPGKDDTEVQKREKAADAHARAYAAKIIAQTKTLDDIPENHKYLIPKVKELLGVKEETPQKSTGKTQDIKELVKFELYTEKLKSLDISKDQSSKLKQRFDYLRTKNFGLMEALEEAIEYARIDLNAQRKELPVIQPGGSPDSGGKRFGAVEDANKMSRKELAEYQAHLHKVARGEV